MSKGIMMLLDPNGVPTKLREGDVLTVRLGSDIAAFTMHMHVKRPNPVSPDAITTLRWSKGEGITDEYEIRLPNHRPTDHQVPRALLYPLLHELIPALFNSAISYVPDSSKSERDPMEFVVGRRPLPLSDPLHPYTPG